MVKTRGLCRALGSIIGRALGTKVSGDTDKAPQWQKPTTSTLRQWAAAPVAEDVEHWGHAVDEVHQQPQEAVIDDVVTDAQDFPGRPHDTLVLTKYEHPKLKLSSHRRKVEKFGRSAPEIEGIMAVTGLSPLIECSLGTGDRGLIFAFAKRWNKETSSFHLPIGEVTISLDDVASLLHLPIIGAFHTFNALHVDQVMDLLVDLLEVSSQEARDEIFQCHGAFVWLSWLQDICHNKCDVGQWIVAARAYILNLVGCTLFANKIVTHMHVVFLDAFRDLSQTGSYSWGAAALVHMYENLNDASKRTSKQLYWIYEHFPIVAYCIADEDYHERKPLACCWKSGKALLVSTYHKRLDRLMSDVVCWVPYYDHRAFREFKPISLFCRQIKWGSSIVIR
ncbi:Protein MAIN-LIKE 1 [Glycine max]|nr:Protein MAIN-LIKE 1 [Glycine max]